MNTLAKSLFLFAVGTAGMAGGWYLAASQPPQSEPAPVAASAEPGSATAALPGKREERPAQDGQAAELAALRAELRALQTQVRQMPAAMSEQARQQAPAEQATRQERLKVLQEQFAASEEKFRAEPVDPGWSRQGSGNLRLLLQKYPALAGQGANVECRSASCRLTLPAGLGEESNEALTGFIQEAQGEFAQVEMFPDRDGVLGGTVLYLSPAEAPDPGVDPALQPKATLLIGHPG